MKTYLTLFFLLLISTISFSQKQNSSKNSSSDKNQNLIAGGSLNLGFGSAYTNLGISPYYGVSLNKYVDLAGTIGINYLSEKLINGDILRQTTYGPGAFVRIFPLKFLYVQGQYEFNFIDYKYIPISGALPDKLNLDANSFLLGGGLASARKDNKSSYFYFSVMWDIAKDPNSPYKDSYGRALPILKAGINIALNQNDKSKNKSGYKQRPPRHYYPWHRRRW